MISDKVKLGVLIVVGGVFCETGGAIKEGPSGVAASHSENRLEYASRPIASDAGVPLRPDRIETFPLPVGTVFKRQVVSGDGTDRAAAGTGTPAAGGERLIYENTLGRLSARPPEGFLISDDIATTAGPGCKLGHYEFDVTGRGDPSVPGGPYSVSFALYDQCPMTRTSDDRDSLIIPGTAGEVSFADGTPRTIVFVVPPDAEVPIPTNFWLGMSFTGENAGMILGAPAMEGFSGDVIDFPGFACNSNLGGFPQQPHGSFNVRIFGGKDCTSSYLGYKAARLSGTPFRGGRDRWFGRDLQLITDDCRMIAYEVGVEGVARFDFALRETGDGPLIPATEATALIYPSDPGVQLARFSFDPPIPLPRDLWFAAKISNDAAGVVVAGLPLIGDVPGDCDPWLPCYYHSLHVSITCDGEAPKGACCDMYVVDDNGESVCREVTEVNCPFPLPDEELQPSWVEGVACDPDPFPHTCGQAACCTPNDTCLNLTRNECDAVPPVEVRRQWQRGRYCGEDSQQCPFAACLAREGDCYFAHDGTGCRVPDCCAEVCEVDSWCCRVEWDRICVELSQESCDQPSYHDDSWSTSEPRGPLLVDANSSTFFTNREATESEDDPGFCCNRDTPGATGFGTVWFKFVATHTSAEISTCASDPAGDSLIQVFVMDYALGGEVACPALTSIGCSDDSKACSDNGSHARVCASNLVPGEKYYVMTASKTKETKGLHQLDVVSPSQCQPVDPWPGDDCNHNGRPDWCDLADGTSSDCNDNEVPDECDIYAGLEDDCQPNGVPDACEEDCNNNGTPDQCDLRDGASPDCNANGIPDECDIDGGSIDDCQPNGIPDDCEMDCNENGSADDCDIADGLSFDCDEDGVPDECIDEIERLTGSSGTAWGIFGASVSLDVGRLVVGAPGTRNNDGVDDGAAVVFRSEGSGWVEESILMGFDAASGDEFGYSVAIGGNLIAVGAPGFDALNESGAGAAYVFHREDNAWIQEAQFVPEDSCAGDQFGWSLAMDGDCVVVGAPFAGDGRGKAYVFRRSGARWIQEADLSAIVVVERDFFGWSVSVSGDRVLVGAYAADHDSGPAAGAAYVFRRDTTGWFLEDKLTASDAEGGDLFGWSTSVDGAVAVVGAIDDDHSGKTHVGSAYVFERRGSTWVENAKLTASDADTGDRFGSAVAVDGGVLVVGAYSEGSRGAAYHFTMRDGEWREAGKLVPSGCASMFGSSASVYGSVALVGTSGGWRCEAAYLFSLGLPDCNDNQVPDACDLRDGTSEDCDQDGVPDECEGDGPADFDLDGDVDLRDLSGFQRCFTGPGPVEVESCCTRFDADPPDSDVDGEDFNQLYRALSGP